MHESPLRKDKDADAKAPESADMVEGDILPLNTPQVPDEDKTLEELLREVPWKINEAVDEE